MLLPALVWGSGNARWLVLAIYVPLLVASFALLFAMVRWTLRSRRPAEVLMTTSFAAMVFVGPLDYMRLGGQGSFEGVYLLAYTSACVMVITGALLVGLLASALSTSRRLTATLDREVAVVALALRVGDVQGVGQVGHVQGYGSLTGR